MKNLFKYTLISILTSTFIGCGSSQSNISDTDNITLKEPTVTQAHKIDRANWVGVAPVDDGISVTSDNGDIAFKFSDDAIENHQVSNIDIFIDVDNNAQTGYTNPWWGNIGAEFLIENNKLYEYAGNGWHWNFIGDISQNQLNNREIEIELWRGDLGLEPTLRGEAARYINGRENNPIIRFIAGLSDQNWQPIKKTAVLSHELDTIAVNPTPNGYSVTSDNQNITFTIQSPNVSNGQMRTEDIFIDSDFDLNTGYRNPRWGNIGADFLIEGNTLYRHNGGRWSWSRVANVHREIDGNTLKITVSKDQLNITNSFITIAGLQNSQWQVIERYDVTPYVYTQVHRDIDLRRVVRQINHIHRTINENYDLMGISPNLNMAIVRWHHTEGESELRIYSIDDNSNISYARPVFNNLNDDNSFGNIYTHVIDDHILEYKYGHFLDFDHATYEECTDRVDYITGTVVSSNCTQTR